MSFPSQAAADCSVSTGGHCDIDVDECASAPCKNNCGCNNIGVNAYVCDASTIYEGWSGPNCDIRIDICDTAENDCSPFAVCSHVLPPPGALVGTGTHNCTCIPGYEGGGNGPNGCTDIN